MTFQPELSTIAVSGCMCPKTQASPTDLIVDSEDFVWSAHWDGWRVTRYDPAGKIEREIRLPGANATCFFFGLISYQKE